MTLHEFSADPPEAGRPPLLSIFVKRFYYPEGWFRAEFRREITTRLVHRDYSVKVSGCSDIYDLTEADTGPDPAAACVRLWQIPRLIGGDIDRRKMLHELGYCLGLFLRLSLSGAAGVYFGRADPPKTCRSSRRSSVSDVGRSW